jgi:hypothetical protein
VGYIVPEPAPVIIAVLPETENDLVDKEDMMSVLGNGVCVAVEYSPQCIVYSLDQLKNNGLNK